MQSVEYSNKFCLKAVRNLRYILNAKNNGTEVVKFLALYPLGNLFLMCKEIQVT